MQVTAQCQKEPNGVVREETGQVLFQGTPAVPLIRYQAAEQAIQEEGHEIDIWLASDVQREHKIIQEWPSSQMSGFWGRPCTYVDVPNGQLDVGVTTNRHERAACVTVAMLVNYPHERQYLPDLDVVQSAAMAAMWMTKKGWVFDNSGNLVPPAWNVTLEQQGHSLIPRLYGHDNNDAVWEQMWICSAFQCLGSGMWGNPSMPEGYVMPADCLKRQKDKRQKLSSSEHRPYQQIQPSIPKDPPRSHLAMG